MMLTARHFSEWCGSSDFQTSYAGTNGDYAGYNVVAYFSEFGCITSPPRLWTEVEALFSQNMSDIWSGGIAFSYFPAESAQGQFGMVTVSDDGSSVQTSDDYNRLKAQYGQVSGPNSPSQSSASQSSYPSCPSANNTFVASTTLPPTPNESACSCLENTLSCRFRPLDANYSTIVGELIGTACSLLGGAGGNCDEIGGNGQSGTYGRISGCDPSKCISIMINTGSL
jgi:1,3-beta-glucanosyltransferase GAS1